MVCVLHLGLVKVAGPAFENVGLRSVLQLPVGPSALVGRPWHLVEAFVEGQVVADRILPVPGVHAVVRVPGTDGLVDLGQGEHPLAGVHEGFGDQLGVGHPGLGVSVGDVDSPALDVLQTLRLLPVLRVEDVLAAVLETLKQTVNVALLGPGL